MNREIKFIYTVTRYNGYVFHSKPFTIEQIESGEAKTYLDANYAVVAEIHRRAYTGLKDKNGKEIYEGDILKSDENVSYHFGDQGQVLYNEDHGGFIIQGEQRRRQSYDQLTCDVACTSEVIGNIFQNNDLLTTQENK